MTGISWFGIGKFFWREFSAQSRPSLKNSRNLNCVTHVLKVRWKSGGGSVAPQIMEHTITQNGALYLAQRKQLLNKTVRGDALKQFWNSKIKRTRRIFPHSHPPSGYRDNGR
jgi:hypothetical protein